VANDLRRIGRAPAILIVAGAALLAFLGLTALGSGHGEASPAQSATAGGPARPETHTATKKQAKPKARTRTCDLGGGVTVTASGGAGCPAATKPAPKPAPTKSTPAAAPAPAARNTPASGLSKLVGARIMTALRGTMPSPALLARARAGQIGGVILFGANISPQLPRAVAALQSAARAGGNPPLIIATDQEGGPIRRITGAPPVAAAAQIAPASAQGQGLATAHALSTRGITTDLAPVADVLGPGGFLGSRSFGSSPVRVAAAACAFARGLQAGGVNATFKHFPGLGKATKNTDLSAVSVNLTATALVSDLAAYKTCQPALVMLSNAVYPALDPQAPAVLSAKIIQGLLRGQLGFRGVTISDTLSAPGVASPTTAVRAAKAGVDILLYTDEAVSARAYSELLGAARAGQISTGALKVSAARIHQLGQ
jgi:beta-N-acetylhexosaminidase